jgi:hypothetical protein
MTMPYKSGPIQLLVAVLATVALGIGSIIAFLQRNDGGPPGVWIVMVIMCLWYLFRAIDILSSGAQR